MLDTRSIWGEVKRVCIVPRLSFIHMCRFAREQMSVLTIIFQLKQKLYRASHCESIEARRSTTATVL
jgi:hypothetical protein